MTRIKICGLRSEEDAGIVNEYCPELAGVIFVKGRKRYVPPERAKTIRQILNSDISLVGVFANEDPCVVAELIEQRIIDRIQLHGTEDGSYIRQLKRMVHVPIIQAFSLQTIKDLEAAKQSEADEILLDSGKGGTGEVFDWSILKNMDRPYILAGGLTPENVERAVKTLHPYGVDVSSGVETGDRKDRKKVGVFVQNVRSITDGR